MEDTITPCVSLTSGTHIETNVFWACAPTTTKSNEAHLLQSLRYVPLLAAVYASVRVCFDVHKARDVEVMVKA